MSDEDKKKLEVPQPDDKQTTPVSSRPVSPRIYTAIQSMFNAASANLVKGSQQQSSSEADKMGGGADEGKTGDGSDPTNVKVDGDGGVDQDGIQTQPPTPQSAKKGTKLQRVYKKYEDADLTKLHTIVSTKYDRFRNDLGDLEDDLDSTGCDLDDAEARFEAICSRLDDYKLHYERFCHELLEKELFRDYEDEDESYAILIRIKFQIKKRIEKLKSGQSSQTSRPAATSGASVPTPSGYSSFIPKLKLPEYDGDVRKWLAFWEAFKPFDEMNVGDGQKLQYLIQSTVPGSAANKLIAAIPPSAANYKTAKDMMKERFGNKKTLIKVYMRDLMKLVVENAKDKPSLSFIDLVTTLTSQVRNLELLGISPTTYGELLYPIIESCVPEQTLEIYMRDLNCKQDLEEILAFLNQEVQRKLQSTLARTPFKDGKEAAQGISGSKSSSNKNGKGSTTTASFLNAGDGNKKCLFCLKPNHDSGDCRGAKNMTLDERKEALKKANACFKCLSADKHNWKKCSNAHKCKTCGKGHPTLLCYGNGKGTQSGGGSPKKEIDSNGKSGSLNSHEKEWDTPPPPPASSSTQMANYVSRPEVQLKVLKVTVHGPKGYKTVRAMFDDGSQSSSVLSSLAEELGLPSMGKERTTHQLFGGHSTGEQVHTIYKIDVSAPGSPHHFSFDCSGVNRISGPIQSIPRGKWIEECFDRGIVFSDVGEPSSELQLLIGGDVEGKLKAGLRSIELSSGPVAHETKLGWVLSGKLPLQRSQNSSGAMMSINMLCKADAVEDLWKLEAIGITDASDTKSRKDLEEAALHHFQETVTRKDDGRYVVHLPWIEAHPELKDNKGMAVKRLESMTRKLKQEGRMEDYNKVFQDWLAEGVIERVKNDGHQGIINYLPHRAVYKEGSTTPLRPVFDASAKTASSPSINSCLEKGPNLLELIPTLLTRFRINKIGVVADIRKAFLQMEVADRDRDSLRFLWWDLSSCPAESPGTNSGTSAAIDARCGLELGGTKLRMVEYRHRRVVFGVSSSPFLLGATLKHLLENSEDYKETADILLRSFYVDNCVVSLPKIKDVEKFKEEAQTLLMKGQFDLRGWEYGPAEEGKIIPVLGLLWNTGQDYLQIDHEKLVKKEIPNTKRGILSLANAVYDPLGILAPFVLLIKLILKKVWRDEKKYGWDHELADNYIVDCRKWQQQLEQIQHVRPPRYFGGKYDNMSNWSLHVFVDASKEAYATCIFLRIEDEDDVNVQLVQARARVSPTTNVTIPRLELLSCLIGARLAKVVKSDLEYPDIPTTYWSDSSTALTWIKKDQQPWATFVMNRVVEIGKISPKENWRHIPGEFNPADVCSRGCNVGKLITSKWWEGPSWLKLSKDEWPSSQPEEDEEEVDREKRRTVVSSVNVKCEGDLFDNLLRCGDFLKITRVLSFVQRFKKNVGGKAEKLTLKFYIDKNGDRKIDTNACVPILRMKELNEAEKTIIRHVQEEDLQDPTKVKGLKCTKFEDKIWRVSTRLTDEEDVDFCSPAVLPGKNEFVRLLILKEHEMSLHAGVHYLQGLLRERYWITNSRRNIGQIVYSCATCKRFNAKRCDQVQAPLPKMRTTQGKVFEVTGVDMAGPLFVENGRKVWICLYTCAVYRAVHLELVSTLSTQGFLEAFNKFICRRGRPRKMYSDNGRNFVGAANLFRKIDLDIVRKYASVRKIDWGMIAPTASWWGGWYERMIGLLKGLLRKVIGSRRVKQSQLEVLLCQAEAVMNERPLTYVSDDPNDLKPLTPAMFLKDLPSHDLPETGLVKRLGKMTRMKEELRKRFRKEYLGMLIHGGSTAKPTDLKPGDVVLQQVDNLKRQDWPVGTILEVYPGIDGKVRSVKLRTKLGDSVRPIQRLFLLEVMGDEMTAPEDEDIDE